MTTLFDNALNDAERESVHRMWAPSIDLESSDINPDVHRCLFDFLGDFIAAWKARNLTRENRVVEEAVVALYRSFDFNVNLDWDPIPYHEQMIVRSMSLRFHSRLTTFPESCISSLPSSISTTPSEEVQEVQCRRQRLPSHRRSSPRTSFRHHPRPGPLLQPTFSTPSCISHN
jgi:hypothetical protein